MATEINTEEAKAAFNKYKSEKVKMLIDFGEVNAANRIDREMSERDFVAGWVLAFDHVGLLSSAGAAHAGAMAQPVGIIKHDPMVHGWHMQPLVSWDKIGLGTKLFTVSGDWIDVENTQPPHEVDVLVKCRNGASVTYDIAGLFHGEWLSQITEKPCRHDVIAWKHIDAGSKEAAS
ncbi:hypothetical protein [Herbaspirillum huttiense]|uniref:hypothetical protein n=1 Tax=Herbaspirillum huttiense TaxID=863372 RepID=UPI0039AEC6EB